MFSFGAFSDQPFSTIAPDSVIGSAIDHKNYLAPFIAGQLPEYIRITHPQFVNFLVAYYSYLDQDTQPNALLLNSANWIDVDTTDSVFVDRLRQQYAMDFPSLIEN